MTIPARDNWCNSCQETCHDHHLICTVCGSTLQEHPPPARNDSTVEGSDRVLPPELADNVRDASRDLRLLLGNIRQLIDTTANAQQELLTDLATAREEWQAVPAALMDPQAQQQERRRPTSTEYLQKMPRIVLESNSFIFHRSCLSFEKRCSDNKDSAIARIEAIPGEFGDVQSLSVKNAVLVVAEPKTGKGGLSTETIRQIQKYNSTNDNKSGNRSGGSICSDNRQKVILYMERGDGLTFCQKAALAQEAGADALVVGNCHAQPWPYVMKDSKGEAVSLNIKIPVVMVKQSDGQAILSHQSRISQEEQQRGENDKSSSRQSSVFHSWLDVQHQSKECVICTESLTVGQTVMRLPACGHVFHEACALQWLKRSNTCPYCRREMPTDDVEYEQERRRTARTHAGSSERTNNGWHDFYG